ncbi:MAG: hypothetical protein N3D11_11860 [Candidatus Sumerlaeia bacterium]|nr:hypothetical protein [Candidatus Sumerlaeia bacterium]
MTRAKLSGLRLRTLTFVLGAFWAAAVVGPVSVRAQEEQPDTPPPARPVEVDPRDAEVLDSVLDAMDETDATTATEEAVEPETKDAGPIQFEVCYSLPTRQLILREWLESGALSLIVPIENDITEVQGDYRRVLAREGSAENRRDLEEIEDALRELERHRIETIEKRLTGIEVKGRLSPEERAEAALLHMALALIYLDEGRARLALGELDRAGGQLPNEPLVPALRAVALREMGRNESAFAAANEALAGEPKLLLAITTVAELHEDQLEYDRAAEMWQRALDVRVGVPERLGQAAARNRQVFPRGAESVRRTFADQFEVRLRWARLRDFAHRYYQTDDRAGFKLIYDPSIGMPLRDPYLSPLRDLVGRYLQGGDAAVHPDEVERMFRQLTAERDKQALEAMLGLVLDSLDSAAYTIGRALRVRRAQPPVVVLYNPDVWESLVASRGTIGLFAPHGRVIGIPLPRGNNPVLLKNTIFHEYGHYATFEITGPRELPLWLVEGIAEFLALDSGIDRYGADPVSANWADLWSREALDRSWFDKGRDTFTGADYFKARAAVGVLVDSFGINRLGEFLETLGNGSDLYEASERAFGMPYRDLLYSIVKRQASLRERMARR